MEWEDACLRPLQALLACMAAPRHAVNRLAEDYGAPTKHQTSITAQPAAGELYEIALQREFYDKTKGEVVVLALATTYFKRCFILSRRALSGSGRGLGGCLLFAVCDARSGPGSSLLGCRSERNRFLGKTFRHYKLQAKKSPGKGKRGRS